MDLKERPDPLVELERLELRVHPEQLDSLDQAVWLVMLDHQVLKV